MRTSWAEHASTACFEDLLCRFKAPTRLGTREEDHRTALQAKHLLELHHWAIAELAARLVVTALHVAGDDALRLGSSLGGAG